MGVLVCGGRVAAGREAHPDNPPAAAGFARAFDLACAASRGGERGEDLAVHVERVETRPGVVVQAVGSVARGAEEALGGEGAGFRDIG